MNEIVPESSEKDSDEDDKNSYVPETPQKDGSPKLSNIIPIPSFTRIRKSLGVLDNNAAALSPANIGCLKCVTPISSKKSSSALKQYRISRRDKSLEKVKMSLFHDKQKEKDFTVQPKSFYGLSEDKPDIYVLVPEIITAPNKRNSKKKKSSLSNSSIHKQSSRKQKLSDINGGVGHGIKRPKRKRSSLKNDSIENEKQIKSEVKFSNESTIHGDSVQENNETEVYNASKKFFKYRYSNRLNINANKKNRQPSFTTTSIYNKEYPIREPVIKKSCLSMVNCNNIENKHELVTKSYSNNVINIKKENCQLNGLENNDIFGMDYEETIDVSLKYEKLNANTLEIDICNSVKDDEFMFPLKNKKDIDDLLKILEDDWIDDAEDEENLWNVTHTSLSPKNSSTFKDTAMSWIAEIKTNNVISSNQTINFENANSSTLEEIPKEAKHTDKKYYPLFCKGYSSNTTSEELHSRKQIEKTFRPYRYNDDKNQYQIDAGQKIFGIIQCKKCNLVYHVGDKNDETNHLKYHNNFQKLKFQGWKTERIVFQDPTTMSRIILVKPSDSSLYHKKVMEILEIINQDLGFYDIETSNKQSYLYIRDKAILGVLVAESVHTTSRMMSELTVFNYSASESSVTCGIYILWTAKNYRRQGIATKLVDVLRANYCYYGFAISIDEIAFSVPTESGKLFAKSYTKTENFKVY